jgi:REP element-mobilizing transposase RayT
VSIIRIKNIEEGVSMPRTARVKQPIGIYHVIVRSVGDINLFRDDKDKEKYFKFIKKYQGIFLFKVYAYCIMSNHAHFIIDCSGADISKFMKSINQCYAMYFNKKYDRHGHVFQDRFKSILVNDDDYLRKLTVYVHNNAKDIRKYRDRIEYYRYSSLGVYLGLVSDKFGILDCDFISGIMGYFGRQNTNAAEAYRKCHDEVDEESSDIERSISEKGEYRSGRTIIIRNLDPKDIVEFVTVHLGVGFSIHVKYNHTNVQIKSVCVLIMRSLCNFTYKQIGGVMGNVTVSNVGKLCERGLKLVAEHERYKVLISELIEKHKAA